MPNPVNSLSNSLDHYWMPFTANARFKHSPKLLVAAKGMHYQSADGQNILDGTAGLWCVNAGHGRRPIIEAAQQQLDVLDYAPNFQIGHPLAFEAASRLTSLFPDPLNRAFFTNSGSEAVDTALKIALAYHRSRGQGERQRLIGRERAYHGVGFGGLSVGGIGGNRQLFGSLLPGVDHLPHTHNLSSNAFSRGQPRWGEHLADDLERIIALHDASTIAAVIIEPLAGSTGVLVPPIAYLQKLQTICQQHDLLLIFDEVITGFGRLGAGFAVDYFDIVPDMVVVAKGLTNGVVPMGAVVVKDEIYESLVGDSAKGVELPHGYTYSGHPVAAATAIASIKLYQEEGLFQRAADLTAYFEDAAHSLRDARHVIDIRNLGLVTGIDLEPRPGAAGERGYELFTRCFEAGVLVRVTGDIIALSPPLIVEKNHINEMFDCIRLCLSEVE